jgi:acyl carrier protein
MKMSSADLPISSASDDGEPGSVTAEEIGAARSIVAQAWAELLGAAPSEPEEDFFTAGGDSLTAIRLVASIRDRLGVALPFRAVFDNSTYGELGDIVAKTRRARSGHDAS